ncbi:caspase family protein [Pendulispora rubella]|uniref:Caspase family protein n=1 Tax=Pendulispora rubella TaxID=2741070 RepID=A0ABZ2LJA7_9BACT
MRRKGHSALALIAVLAGLSVANAAPVRILIAAGANHGLSDDRPLSHPQSDATAVRDVFTSLGWVRADHAILLRDATKGALVAAFERARAIAGQHAASEVTLVVYFSGHGDRASLHVHGEGLPEAELSAHIAQVPAALRIVVIDACRTTEVLRAKGMNVQPGFTVQLPAQPAATGSVWVHASADGEAAQESDEIGGALFTHFWLAGLRGAADTNGDGRVTFEESFTYAYHHTLLRSARSGGVLQRPEVTLALREAAPLVLTETAGERAQLEFPREADSLYLVYAVGSQSVVAEVSGAADRGVRITLPRGRYIVQKRTGAHGTAAEVSLSASTTRVLTPSDFRHFPMETLAQKGTMVVRPWSVALSNTVFRGTAVDVGDELSVRIERRQSDWAYAFAPFGGLALRATEFNDVREWFTGAELSLDRLFVLGGVLGAPTLVRVGADARGQWIWQSVRRNDSDRLASLGYETTSHRAGSAFGGGLHAAWRVSPTPSFYAEAGLRAFALAAKTDSGVEGRVLGGLWLSAGALF